MGLVTFLGTILLGFGPVLALNTLVVFRRSQLLVIEISSAFFALIALVTASLLWWMVPPLKAYPSVVIIEGVAAQEIMRYLFFMLYERAERGVSRVPELRKIALNDLATALAAGAGFGGIHCLVVYGNVIADSLGDGSFKLEGCPMSIYTITAITCLLFTVHHVLLFVVAFAAYRAASLKQAAAVALLHLFAGLASLLNGSSGGCWSSMLLVLLVNSLLAVLSARAVRSGALRNVPVGRDAPN